MDRTPRPIKVYVSVDVAFDDSGRMRPRVIHWEDGGRYKIDKVLDVRPAPAVRAGGQGDRYKIRLLGKDTCRETYLFFEYNTDCASQIPGRWFVERRAD